LKPARVHNFGTYFITTQTWERRDLFHSERLARLFLETLYHYRSESKYLLHEFVLMPNHLHLLITPSGITLERALQLIKGGFSHRASKEVSPNLEVWQRGFTDHRIRDAEDYAKHRRYILQNPVEARLRERAEDYPYCSAAPGFELDPVPFLG
jgi:putative transposase